ncbi:MAG: VirB8/TrbF family protein [Pseudomonadota bacterium]
MMFNRKNQKQTIEKQYFEEAQSWDSNTTLQLKKSESRAWKIAGAAVVVAVLQSVGIASLFPLKSIEPFVIRVDNNTGIVDTVSLLKEHNEAANEAVNKYFLSEYIRHREGYLWETRESDRDVVGLMSDHIIQQEYANLTNPNKNPSAPVVAYGQNTKVNINIKSISILNAGEAIDSENHVTALVRYTKNINQTGDSIRTTHWSATVTFTYRNTPMRVDDRLLNPLGFQVLGYRNDPESGGEV